MQQLKRVLTDPDQQHFQEAVITAIQLYDSFEVHVREDRIEIVSGSSVLHIKIDVEAAKARAVEANDRIKQATSY